MSEKVRVFKRGDEEAIASLLRECFDTFNNYGLNAEKWLEYTQINEGFRLDGAYVLELDGTILSHIQVVEKNLRTAAGLLPTAGIANVATHPAHRGKGYATRLLKKALEDYRAKGFPLTALFTGFASGPQKIYRKIGYMDVCVDRNWVAPLDDVKRLRRRLPWIELREAEERDFRSVSKLYEKEGEFYTGWPTRPQRDWIEKMFKRTAYHTVFYVERKQGNFIVAEEGGEVLGYAAAMIPPWDRESMSVVEMLARRDRPDVLQALLTSVVERAEGLGARTLVANLPAEPPFKKYLRVFQPRTGGGVFMSDVLSLDRLLYGVLPEAAKSVTETVSIEFNYRGDKASVTVGGGEAALHGEKVQVRVDLDPEAFNRLLFGYSTPLELLMKSTISSEIPLEKVLEIFEALFKPKTMFIWPIDHW
ncbi:MAG: GNAT family N-acetyltransferase [Thermofilaceae archaeon]|nr:GNAT family N-acetyltransferase [Thermofilaceae archaeon]